MSSEITYIYHSYIQQRLSQISLLDSQSINETQSAFFLSNNSNSDLVIFPNKYVYIINANKNKRLDIYDILYNNEPVCEQPTPTPEPTPTPTPEPTPTPTPEPTPTPTPTPSPAAGCCCIDGTSHPEIFTEQECSLLGGLWYAGDACVTNDSRCCDTVTLCKETIYGTFEYSCGEDMRLSAPRIPSGGPGVVAYEGINGLSCTSGGMPFSGSDNPFSCTDCDGFTAEQEGDIVIGSYYYYQYRSIENCSECTNSGTHPGNSSGCHNGKSAFLVVASPSFLEFLKDCNPEYGLCVDYTCE